MRTLKWVLAGLVAGLVIVALRGPERRSTSPTGPRAAGDGAREPILGYDGMNQETLLSWLDGASLDDETVEALIRYERAHRRREPVLEILEEMLG